MLLSFNSLLFAQTPPDPGTQCDPPAMFDHDVVAVGTVNWTTLLPAVSPNNVTQKVRITGTGTVNVENSDLLLKAAGAVLVVDGLTLQVRNGNFKLETAGARAIFTDAVLRVSGNTSVTGSIAVMPQTSLCMTNCEVEIGDEEANGYFSSGGNSTSADFQNEGGYRYLESVCLNITHDLQLSSNGNGTAAGGGLDVFINVVAEIGDRGPTHASASAFGVFEGDDSGNLSNSNRMEMYNSAFIVANGNVQNNSSSTMIAHATSFKLNNGNFQNSGTLNGSDICVGADDEIQQGSGSWQAGSVSTWYAGGSTSGALPFNPPAESAPAAIDACIAAASCTGGGGCTDPECSITGPDPVCSGTTGHVYSAPIGMDTYVWSIAGNGLIPGATAGQTASVNAGAAGTYTVTVTISLDGCTSSCSRTVTVNAKPTCSISGPDYVCSNTENIVYTAPAGMSAYSWGISGAGSIPGSTTGASVSVTSGNFPNDYTVSVTVTDANGCTSSCSKQSFIFLEKPLANITVNPNPVCLGAILDLSISAAASSTVSWSGEGITNPNGNPSTTAMPTTTGPHIYSVTVTTNPAGCVNTGTVNVTVDDCCSGTVLNINSPTPGAANNVTGMWTVPVGGPYKVKITVKGGKGGNRIGGGGGGGATMVGEFILVSGQTLQAVAGAAGSDAVGALGASGGNGSAVSMAGNPMVVAGGGGGSASCGCWGGTGQTGINGEGNLPDCGGAGGVNGGDGANGISLGGTGGKGYVTGMTGGGGHASGATGGGGGGYSGGGGGGCNGGGGGGGSYNLGANQINTAGANNSGGEVIIECLGMAVLTATVSETQPDCANPTQGSLSIDLTGDVDGSTTGLEYAIVSGNSFTGSPTFMPITADPFNITSGFGTTGDADGETYTIRVRLSYNTGIFLDYTYTLTAKVPPTCNITGGPTTVCANSTGHAYQATGGGTYAWSIQGNGAIDGSNTGASVSVDAGASGTYTLTVTVTANGCTSTCSQEVTVHPLPVCSISDAMAAVCPNSVGNQYSAPPGMDSYAWSIDGNGSIPGSLSGQSIDVTAGASGTYTVTVTITKDGCTSSCSKTVQIDFSPFMIVYSPQYCAGDPGPVIGLNGSEVGVLYQLQTSGGTNLGAPVSGTGAPISFGAYPNGNYNVVIVGGACSGTLMATVNATVGACNIDVPDFCSCNAPGEFTQVTIKINAPDGQNWTMKAVTGLYSAPNVPLAVGTPLMPIGGNMYTLTALRDNAKGYWVQVTNGSTSLDIMVGNPSW